MRKELKAEFAKEQFDEAMAKLQSEMPIIEKKKDVDNKYKYATIDSIVSQTREFISKNGFSYITKLEFTTTNVKAICIVKHVAGHSESSEMDVPLVTKTNIMSGAQQTAATATFAKRYAFLNAFGIMTGDEDKEKSMGGNQDTEVVGETEIEAAIGKLNQCMTEADLKKVFFALPKAVQANKEVIMFANQIKQNIKNENV